MILYYERLNEINTYDIEKISVLLVFINKE